MDIDKLLEAVEDLSPDDLERLKTRIAERESKHKSAAQHTAEEWLASLEAAVAEFRGDSSEEEMREIAAAMSMKSHPSCKGLRS